MTFMRILLIAIVGFIFGVYFAPESQRVLTYLGLKSKTIEVVDNKEENPSVTKSETSTTSTHVINSVEDVPLALPGVPTNVMIINNGEITKSETVYPESETNPVVLPSTTPLTENSLEEDSSPPPVVPDRHCYNESGDEISCRVFDNVNDEEVE